MLDDGDYEALVFDAGDDDGGVTIEVTIIAGEHKGEVLSIRSENFDGDPLDLLGVPATITVTGGTPSVVFEN